MAIAILMFCHQGHQIINQVPKYIKSENLDSFIQLGFLFQRIIIIINSNMKTILAFSALAALAVARPDGIPDCPPGTPIRCWGKYPLIHLLCA